MSLKSAILFSLIIIIFISCAKGDLENMRNEDDFEFKLGYINGIITPSVGKVNEIIDIGIYSGVTNDCSGVNRFIETTEGDTITIGIEIRTARECYSFGPVLPEITYYPFKASTPGVYYLKFISSPTAVIKDSLVITE